MRTLLMAGAAALSMALAPTLAAAQSDVPGSTNSINDKRQAYNMTEEQQSLFEMWTDDRKADYANWPYEYQVYYWDLAPDFQTGYWVLTPDQRQRLYIMSEVQQAEAWKSIMAQMADGTVDRQTVTFASTAVVQDAPPPRQGEYPICGKNLQDNCMNARAARNNG